MCLCVFYDCCISSCKCYYYHRENISSWHKGNASDSRSGCVFKSRRVTALKSYKPHCSSAITISSVKSHEAYRVEYLCIKHRSIKRTEKCWLWVLALITHRHAPHSLAKGNVKHLLIETSKQNDLVPQTTSSSL